MMMICLNAQERETLLRKVCKRPERYEQIMGIDEKIIATIDFLPTPTAVVTYYSSSYNSFASTCFYFNCFLSFGLLTTFFSIPSFILCSSFSFYKSGSTTLS